MELAPPTQGANISGHGVPRGSSKTPATTSTKTTEAPAGAHMGRWRGLLLDVRSDVPTNRGANVTTHRQRAARQAGDRSLRRSRPREITMVWSGSARRGPRVGPRRALPEVRTPVNICRPTRLGPTAPCSTARAATVGAGRLFGQVPRLIAYAPAGHAMAASARGGGDWARRWATSAQARCGE